MASNQLAYTLDSSFFISHEIYEKEKEAIFYRSWQYACHKSQLKTSGSYVSFEVGSESLFVIRGKDQKVRAFYNVCPHRAHRLVAGCGNKQVVVCPYHAWSFFLEGGLCAARGTKDVEGFDPKSIRLNEVLVEEFLGFIFVNLDPKAASIKSLSGNLEDEIRSFVPELDKLVFAHRIPYEINANWKIVVDNYLECYHCPPTHPDFVDLVDLKTYRSKTYDYYSSHIGNRRVCASTAYAVQSEDQTVFGGWWLWPNISFTVFPGRSNITIMDMKGVNADHTRENFDFFFLDETPNFEEQAAIDYIQQKLQPEDVALAESVHQGLHSRAYYAGPLVIDRECSEMSEHSLLHFHNLVRQALG